MTFKKQHHDYAIESLDELITVVGWLAANLTGGIDRPPKAPALSLERRLHLREQAKAERIERSDLAPGDTEAPFDLDVMDVLTSILEVAEDMTTRVCVVLNLTRPRPADSAFTDPRPALTYLRRLLPDAAGDVDLLLWVERSSAKLVEDANDALGLPHDGQVLKVCCPWCKGRTEDQPLGGAHTLRIRLVRGMDTPVVTCEGGLCQPPEADCGTWVRGKPAWLQSEWEWLALRLEQAS